MSEGRIELEGQLDFVLGVPVLSRQDMYTEKLLANADRGREKSKFSRVMMGLDNMPQHWGPCLNKHWQKPGQLMETALLTSQ